MKRHHTIVVAAVMSLALSGCAVLVQYGQPEVQTVGAYQSFTDLAALGALSHAP